MKEDFKDLEMRDDNLPAHKDIQQDLERTNGLYTFTIRVNAGKIVDYVYFEHGNYQTA